MAAARTRTRPLSVSLLGPVEVRDHDRRLVTIGGPQQQRLLLALSLDPSHPVAAARLSEMLWPDRAPADAVGALQTYVWRLRQALGRDVITSSELGYAVDTGSVAFVHLEVERTLAEARGKPASTSLPEIDAVLAAWRGPALGTLRDEWWALPLVQRLDSLRIDALNQSVDLLLQLGRVDDAVARSEVAVGADPLREASVLRRMVALQRAGRSVDATRVGAAFRRRLGNETGMEPSNDLARLERRMIAGEDGADDRSTVRGYVLGEVIGRGRDGVVHLATQPLLGREVAVKVVRASRADDPEFVRRFEAEAQLVARLEHPGIVPLYDFWREPGGAYLVFRYMRGGSVAARFGSSSTWTLDDVDDLVTRVGSALAAAHRMGIAHCDVTPANLLYDDDANVHLADFGIASDTHDGDAALADVVDLAEIVADALGRIDGDEESLGTVASLLHRARLGELDAEHLVREWRSLRQLSSPTPAHAGVPTHAGRRNPFKGLRPFSEADRLDFFGRREVVDAIVARLEQARFISLVGASGSGKSSIADAGVAPEMRRRGYAVTSLVPGRHPVRALCDAWRRIATEAATIEMVDAPEPEQVLAAMGAARPPVLLVIDQMEELWTQSVAHEREAVLDALAAACVAAPSPLRILTTLRADQYDRPLADARVASLVADGTRVVTPLDAPALEQAVRGPLEAVGVGMERGLLARILTDVQGQPGALPLMQFALSLLFDRNTGPRLTLAAYDAIGGVSGALALHAERIHAELERSDQVELRRLFGRLVVPGDHADEDLRRRVPLSELNPQAVALVERLRSERLLVLGREDLTRMPSVEVAHESLFREWPRLVGWLDDDRVELRGRARTEQAAEDWARADFDPAYLLSGSRLAEVAAVEDAVEVPDATVERFLRASRQAEMAARRRDRRRLRRTQALLAATSPTLTGAIVAGIVASRERDRAQNREQSARASAAEAQENAALVEVNLARAEAAESEAQAALADANEARVEGSLRRLAAEAGAVAAEQPDLGLLLAVEAARRMPGVESDDALLTALAVMPDIERVVDIGLAPDDGVRHTVVADAGPIVVVSGREAVVVDRTSLEPTGVRWAASGNSTAVIDPTGTEIAMVAPDGLLERRSLLTGAVIGPSIQLTGRAVYGRANPLLYQPDGSLLVGNASALERYDAGGVLMSSIELGAVVGTLTPWPEPDRVLVSVLPELPGRSMIVDLADGSVTDLTAGIVDGYLDDAGRLIIASPGLPSTVQAIDVATRRVVAVSPPVTGFVVAVLALPGGAVYAQTLLNEVLVLTPELTIRSSYHSELSVIGRGPDGSVLGSLGSRLAEVDADRRPAIITQLDIGGPVFPRRIDDVLVASSDGASTFVDPRSYEPVPGATPDPPITASMLVDVSTEAGWAVIRSEPGLTAVSTGSWEALGGPVPDEPMAALSPTADRLATVDADRISMYRMPGLDRIWTADLVGQTTTAVRWSPDGTFILVTDLGTQNRLVDAETGESWAVPGYWGDFLDDGLLLLGGSAEPVRLFDPRRREVLETFTVARSAARVFAVPGRSEVLRIDLQANVFLFDVESGRRLGPPVPTGLDLPSIDPSTVSFDATGSSAIVAPPGLPALRVELSRDRWIELACAIAGRNLTEDEWQDHLGDIAPYAPTCDL